MTTATPVPEQPGSPPREKRTASRPDLDQPGFFYLGREYDLAAHNVQPKPVLYDAHDLTTHAVVVGMTGSGKTGLGITLLEEAALQNIPCIVVDLKGDLSNLLLQFPEVRPEDFEPWIDPDEARRKNIPLEEYARQLSDKWHKGLADWALPPERLARLHETSDWRIYTPGSGAGLPVSVIQNFAAPKNLNDTELLNDRVEATTNALLGLTNITADPVQSREHILIANLLLHAWTEGRDLDLPHLISEITTPPLRKIGTFDIDMFYPEEERLKLALALNNLLASPSFSTWITGEPFNLASMLHDPDGKPRQLVFYLAHLDDPGRMFFLSLLLEEVLTWMRSQPGTTSLRALLYLDEVYGYLPPYPANPPTKRPLMTLLKQARAFGVGVVLATQNPMDLDYKALTNAGTWFIGKLQTDRDKARLVEGLQGVAAEKGTLTDGNYLDTAISSLGNQVFLLHDVHDSQARVFHTRWAMSYLFGPMTRDHIAQLMGPRKEQAGMAAGGAAAAGNGRAHSSQACPKCHAVMPVPAKFCMECGTHLPQEVPAAVGNGTTMAGAAPAALAAEATLPAHVPPVLPPGLIQFFLPPADPAAVTALPEVVFAPRLLAYAQVTFRDARYHYEHEHRYHLLAAPPDPIHPQPWEDAEEVLDTPQSAPTVERARWLDVPSTINDPRKLRHLEKDFVQFLFENAAMSVYLNSELGLLSRPEEDHDAFRQRCREAARHSGHKELKKWVREQQASQEESPAAAPAAETAETHDHDGHETSPFAGDPQKEKEWQRQTKKIAEKWQKKAARIKRIALTPRKKDIRVTHFGLAWAPGQPGGETPETLQPLYHRQDLRSEFWRTAPATSETVEEPPARDETTIPAAP